MKVPKRIIRSLNDVIIQVFGANTDVGKTVICAGLCRESLRQKFHTFYVKPVQTGSDEDETVISKYIDEARTVLDTNTRFEASTLFKFKDPLSPHLAAMIGGRFVSDEDLVSRLTHKLENFQTSLPIDSKLFRIVETAGGVLSPGPSGSLQADILRPLRLFTLLVGDVNLGGIGVTLSAIESLRIRGYSIIGVVFIGSRSVGSNSIQHKYSFGNVDAVESHISKFNIPVFRVGRELPPKEEPLDEWYAKSQQDFCNLFSSIRSRFCDALDSELKLKETASARIWWPFTQHSTFPVESIVSVESAYGNDYTVMKESAGHGHREISYSQMLDSPASWWTQGVGHGNSDISLAIAEANGRYGHIIFPGVTHLPAVKLAEAMIDEGPGRGWATRAFFSDNGSTAVEVAIKMGFRKFQMDRWGREKVPDSVDLQVIAQSGCYHGDTLGVMNVAEPSIFNCGQHPWYTPKGLFLVPPTLAWRNGCYELLFPDDTPKTILDSYKLETFTNRMEAFDLAYRSKALRCAYEEFIESKIKNFEADQRSKGLNVVLGSLLLEPIMLGAGGMQLVDPLWQRTLINICKRRMIPVIFDEVFCGLWRLGYESASVALGVHPDISCYAKLLTGGTVPLSITLASEDVFDAFSGDSKTDALLHGHSYTAYPIGCAAALQSLQIYKMSPNYRGSDNAMLEQWDDTHDVRALSLFSKIDRAVSVGTVLAFEVKTNEKGYGASGGLRIAQTLQHNGIFSRVLGNVVYCMVTPNTPASECKSVMEKYHSVVEQMQLVS